ncbi:hypothetical protein APHNP_1474 [Anaplasma phagocytophilum str. ApNP]|uniref:Uncharacterized protein n=1 Tax=Anaplasma phagocytophilum str. ApNP TaxID=1359153 RepID=A0A0F3NF27_ANAPH|nr:hypothetical protein APHNP_1474 [Anaplasma phagocytophilum str. ApNP]
MVQTHKWSNKKASISHRNKTLKSFDCQCVEYLVLESMLSDVYGTFFINCADVRYVCGVLHIQGAI